MRKTFLKITEDWAGYNPVRRHGTEMEMAAWNAQCVTALRLLENSDGLTSAQWSARMEEAMGSADFPLMIGDVLDRKLLMAYQDTPNMLADLCAKNTAPDFRLANRYRFDGADGLLTEIGEQGEYPFGEVDEVRYQIKLKKWGRRIALAWETWLGDDLGAFNSFPDRLARAVRRTEEYLLTTMFFDANGPHASLFGTNAGNQSSIAVTTFSLTNLKTAIGEFGAYEASYDTDLPIMIKPKYLVVPPATEIEAREALTSSWRMWTDGGSGTAAEHSTMNVIGSYGLQLRIGDWIPKVATSKPLSWFLSTDPNSGVAPVEFIKLRGREEPELFMRSANAQRVGGGAASPFDGSYEFDILDWKVRHCMNAAQRDPLAVWGSTGAGS